MANYIHAEALRGPLYLLSFRFRQIRGWLGMRSLLALDKDLLLLYSRCLGGLS